MRESHFTPKQLELFQERYDDGYNLCTDPDYVMWMTDNHPTDVPDDLLGEYSSQLDSARSDPFQPFDFVNESPEQVTREE